MKILYDYQAFTMQYWGGISNCFCKLISNSTCDFNYEIGIEQSNNFHIKESDICPNIVPAKFDTKNFLPYINFRGKGRIYSYINKLVPFLPTAENINKRKSIELLKKGDFDIFHPTFFDDYFLPYLNNKPFVLTIHDMIPELFPQYYYQKNDLQIINKRKLANKAAAIIAVSNKTKEDIIDILKIPEKKITVIYHGGPKVDIKINEEHSLIISPYFLYVGARERYKNFKQTIWDFKKFNELHKNVKLICTGNPFTQQEWQLISSLKLEDSIKNITANEQELKKLYSNAIAFIFPSLYEGFGIPILEAFAYGCPILLNEKSCFPEIADNAAIYFNSDELGSNLFEKMCYIYNLSQEKRDNLINLGYNRLSFFSWEKSSDQLYSLYKKILEQE